MDKDDREAVYRKAGVRKLPIVFIDDVYRGDYDDIVQLNESGKLDDLLHMDRMRDQLVSAEEHMARLKLAGKP